jgi:threonine/homoserine/homoserine lactone efflux protein
MLEYILIGGGFAFAAAAQPGPLQAFLLSRVAAVGWKRTLPAAFAPVISDGPIAVVMLTLLHHVARGFESFLRGAGGVVLLYFAVRTFLEWRRAKDGIELETTSSPRTLLQAVGVNFVNPGPYIGWSLILGPVAVQAWAEAPVKAVVLVTTFYVVMVVSLALFILLLGTTSFLGPRGRRALLLAASIALAGIAIYSFASILV